MLRVVTEQHGDAWTISLHGRLADAWVELVEGHWQSLLDAVSPANVTVLLSDVSFIDAEGERLLERMWRRGTGLEASGCMNRHLIDTIRVRKGTGPDTRTRSLNAAAPRRGSES